MKSLSIRGIVFSALFAALTVVLNFLQVNLGFTPVPITLGNLGVMLAGALLGGGYGFLSMLWIVVLTAIGLPLLDGYGGMATLLGPSGGFVWFWPICALFTGLLVRRVKGKGPLSYLLVFVIVEVFGSLLDYFGGVPWLAHVQGISIAKAFAIGGLPFLPGDAIKAVVTALIVVPVRSVYPVTRLVGKPGSNVVPLSE